MAWTDLTQEQKFARFKQVLTECFYEAEAIVEGRAPNDLPATLSGLYDAVRQLGSIDHAAPGIALTLAAYKVCDTAQDVTAHKDEFAGGFSARAFDTHVTVPFLIAQSLPRNVESHWLTQTFSFAPEFRRGLILKTQPKAAGPLVIEVVPQINSDNTGTLARAATIGIFVEKIIIRNKSKVILTRPKDLSIETTVDLVERHLRRRYTKNAPRLPQLVLYAAYQCLIRHIGRYNGCSLDPIERLKSADRKANTVGDVVVRKDGVPFEAVEIKYDQAITLSHVCEAIEKVRALSVLRYYILSTANVSPDYVREIQEKKDEFLKQNGCELIVNGVAHSLSYYLRLLPNTTEFLFNYSGLVEADADTNYEHRIGWNECCQSI